MALADKVGNVLAWWELEEESGTRVDAAGNFNLTDNNTVGFTASGLIGNAASFVSANLEYLSYAGQELHCTGDWTLAIWVHDMASQAGVFMALANAIGDFTNPNRNFLVQHETNEYIQARIYKNASGGYDSVYAPVTWTSGWDLILLWRDDAAGRVYISVNNAPIGDSPCLPTNIGAGDFRIGTTNTNTLNTYVDSVVVFDTVLTAAERTELYNSGAGVSYSDIAATVPADPTALALTPGLTTMALTWTDNSDDEDGFKVERSPNGTTGWTLINTTAADATSYNDTGLTPNTTYYYRVSATNAEGDSGYTSANATTDAYVSDDSATWTPPVRARTFTPPTRGRTWTPPTRSRTFTLP